MASAHASNHPQDDIRDDESILDDDVIEADDGKVQVELVLSSTHWLITNPSCILQLSMPMTLYTRTRRIPLRYEATSIPDPQMLEVEEVEEEEVSPATT